VTIDVLPDNVLLEVFEFYLGKDDADEVDYDHNYDGWQTLVHICHRWRRVVFTSPRRLDLKLFCTQQRLINLKMLDIWAELPIVVIAEDVESEEDVTNIITALRQHNRVCRINYCHRQFQDSLLKAFAAIDEPCLALTSLDLSSSQQQNVPVLPDSFLGGSAPRLRSIDLNGIPYPSIGTLLLSTTNLVQLSIWRIPHSGYISPETIVPCLSTLTRLESLDIGFQYTQSLAHGASRHPPLVTRIVLPNLTSLGFNGDIEYLENLLSRVETPILHESRFCFFNQLVFDTPLLGDFICRTETFTTIHAARIQFFSWAIGITLSGREEMATREALRLEITCKPLDWQLSALAQVLNSFMSSLGTLERLDIGVYHEHEDWQDEIEATQWLETLRSFTSVKEMTLESKDSVRLVTPALQELAGEGATEVLPALQKLFLRTYGRRPWGPFKEAIEQFVATRQLHGQPIAVHYKRH